MTAAVQAGAPLPVLVNALAREGWGELAGPERAGARRVLTALSQLCDPIKGTADTTAAQVAEVAGLSLKWTRAKLAELERLGLLLWRRGDLVCGRPTAGWIKVQKRAVVALVSATRAAGDKARRAAERARDTAARVTRSLHWSTQRNNAKRGKTPSRADGNSVPPFSPTGELGVAASRPTTPRSTPRKDHTMASRPLFAARYPDDRPGTTTGPQPGHCGVCGETWAEHTRREAKLPRNLRHDWEPPRPRKPRTTTLG